jgi:hypothetical protein
MWHDIRTKFHEDWYRHSINIMVLPQKFGRLQCWYYWREGFFNYAVEMSLGVMIIVPSFKTIG